MIRRLPMFEDGEACTLRVGVVYQRRMPGLSGRQTFRVIAEPWRQQLGDVTHREAVLEGQTGRRALERWRVQWVRRQDRAWLRSHPTASDEDVLRRWRMRHARRWCWVVEFDLLDPVRCMAEQRDILSGRSQHGNASGVSGDYVASGGIDPYAEAVDPAEVARLSSTGTRETRTDRRQARRRRLFDGPRVQEGALSARATPTRPPTETKLVPIARFDDGQRGA